VSSVLIPYYRVSNFCIDAYMLDKIGEPLERILLVKDLRGNRGSGNLNPLPFPEVLRLMREPYDLIRSENFERRRITGVEATLYPLINPSLYMRSREEEIVQYTTLKLYERLYERVLKEMEKGEKGLEWGEVRVEGDRVYLNVKMDRGYTLLFTSDEKFKVSLREVLK
jgi:hypothetical protein